MNRPGRLKPVTPFWLPEITQMEFAPVSARLDASLAEKEPEELTDWSGELTMREYAA